MHDSMLELWLRLLSLHLPEPTNAGDHRATIDIRNQWLLASRGYFMGCVPHCLEDACSTDDGRAVIRLAVDSLLAALAQDATPLQADTLNLLGIEGGQFTAPVERQWLLDIGQAFHDLLDDRIRCVVSSTDVMPGSIPYERTLATE